MIAKYDVFPLMLFNALNQYCIMYVYICMYIWRMYYDPYNSLFVEVAWPQ